MKKIILITGASSGFGLFTAKALIKKGYVVYGAARRIEKMQELVELGGFAIKMDVTDEESVKAGVQQIINEQGQIDVLVNNAGYAVYSFVETADIEQTKRMFDVNVWGLVRVSQAVLPFMREKKSGTIINISSVVGKVSTGFLGFYSATKHAVEAISDATRQEVSRFGIKVAIVEPGAFKTGFDDVVHDELKQVKAGEAYQGILDKFIPAFDKMYKKAPSPEPVVKVIEKIINTKNPKVRYPAGVDAKFGIVAKDVLHDKIFDKLIMKQMKIN